MRRSTICGATIRRLTTNWPTSSKRASNADCRPERCRRRMPSCSRHRCWRGRAFPFPPARFRHRCSTPQDPARRACARCEGESRWPTTFSAPTNCRAPMSKRATSPTTSAKPRWPARTSSWRPKPWRRPTASCPTRATSSASRSLRAAKHCSAGRKTTARVTRPSSSGRLQGGAAIASMLQGCSIEMLPPNAFHSACRDADRASRAFSLRASVSFLDLR
jgi:hypothetical protein